MLKEDEIFDMVASIEEKLAKIESASYILIGSRDLDIAVGKHEIVRECHVLKQMIDNLSILVIRIRDE